MKKVPDETNEAILACRLLDPGLSLDEIAAIHDVSVGHAQTVVAKWREDEWAKLSVHRRAHLVSAMVREPKAPLLETAKRWGLHPELVREAAARAKRKVRAGLSTAKSH